MFSWTQNERTCEKHDLATSEHLGLSDLGMGLAKRGGGCAARPPTVSGAQVGASVQCVFKNHSLFNTRALR